jgi:hypothetical protein
MGIITDSRTVTEPLGNRPGNRAIAEDLILDEETLREASQEALLPACRAAR